MSDDFDDFDDFDSQVKNFDKWFKRGVGFFIFWFIFCLLLAGAGLSAVCWVGYKLLTHFGII